MIFLCLMICLFTSFTMFSRRGLIRQNQTVQFFISNTFPQQFSRPMSFANMPHIFLIIFWLFFLTTWKKINFTTTFSSQFSLFLISFFMAFLFPTVMIFRLKSGNICNYVHAINHIFVTINNITGSYFFFKMTQLEELLQMLNKCSQIGFFSNFKTVLD